MNTKITLDDLLQAEEEVLRRIGAELESESVTVGRHMSHTMGHTMSGGHFSTTARVETLNEEQLGDAASDEP
jgi:hypothetical protein